MSFYCGSGKRKKPLKVCLPKPPCPLPPMVVLTDPAACYVICTSTEYQSSHVAKKFSNKIVIGWGIHTFVGELGPLIDQIGCGACAGMYHSTIIHT